MRVSQKLYNSIVNSPKGVAPAGIQVAKQVAKQLTKKEEYVSQKRGNLGNTYTRYAGVVSVLKKPATPATRKQAFEQKKAKEKKK